MRDYRSIYRQWNRFLNESTYANYKGKKKILRVPNMKLVIDIDDMRLIGGDHRYAGKYRHQGSQNEQQLFHIPFTSFFKILSSHGKARGR